MNASNKAQTTSADHLLALNESEAMALQNEMTGHLDTAFDILASESQAFRLAGLTYTQLLPVAATLATGLAQLHAAAMIAKAVKPVPPYAGVHAAINDCFDSHEDQIAYLMNLGCHQQP